MVATLQPLQHRVDHLTDVLGAAVDAVARAVRIDPESKFRRNHDPVAQGRQRLADELFVRERTVGFSGVEERHAALDRRVNDRDALPPVRAGAVDAGQPHAAIPDRRYLEPAVAETALFNDSLTCCARTVAATSR